MLRGFRILTLTSFLAVILLAGCIPFGPGFMKAKPPRTMTFLISSNTVSNFTPCGCHSGKWGGMPRRGSIFAQAKQEIASKPKPGPVLVVDTGDVSQGSAVGLQQKKDEYIFQAYNVIKYDAVNAGMNDLRLGQTNLKQYETQDSIPWVSCNTYNAGVFPPLPVPPPPAPAAQPPQPGQPGSVPPSPSSGANPGQTPPTPPPAPSSGNAQAQVPNRPGASGPNTPPPQGSSQAGAQTPPAGKPGDPPVFSTFQVVEKPEAPGFKIGIIGAMVDDAGRLNGIAGYSFEQYNDAIMAQINKLRRTERVDLVVLLCDTDATDLEQRLSTDVKAGLDLVIGGRGTLTRSSNAIANPLSEYYVPQASAPQSEQQPGSNAAPGGADPGAQGGNQPGQVDVNAAVNQLPPLNRPLFVPKAQARGRLVRRLDLTLNDKGELVDYQSEEIQVSDSYPDDPQMAQIALGYDTNVLAVELNGNVSRVVAGSAACYQCHPGFESVWADNSQFHSYQTIVDQNKLDDRSCTRCHAIGYFEEPRLLTYDLVPENLRDVGCEGCHPSGQRHISFRQQRMMMTPEQLANNTEEDSMATQVDASTCVTCHSGQYGVGFNAQAAVEAARAICMSVKNPTVVPPETDTSNQGAQPGPPE